MKDTSNQFIVGGAGLGLRKPHISQLLQSPNYTQSIDFLELAPENWIGFSKKAQANLKALTERYPAISHGLSLSIGGPLPLDEKFLLEIKQFLQDFNILSYSEHLSYSTDEGYLYDLLPIPFTDEAIEYVSKRIKRVQEILERRIAIENVSYYTAPGSELSEIEFVTRVLKDADCELLLDINNIYVNSINHNYDAVAYLQKMPTDKIAYAHIAGHYNEAEDLIVDTHGADVIDPVWCLLEKAYEIHGVFPTLLERDFNIPSLDECIEEIEKIRQIQGAKTNVN